MSIESFVGSLLVWPLAVSMQVGLRFGWIPSPSDPGCHQTTLSVLRSPDTAWTAVIDQEVCSGVGIASTSVTNVVSLLEAGEKPELGNAVLAFDAVVNQLPIMEWVYSDKLQITVPNKSWIGMQKNSLKTVQVVVKFYPDYPAEREQWLRGLALTPK